MRLTTTLLLGVSALYASTSFAVDCESADTQAEIQQFMLQMDAGWDARNAQTVASLYSQDADMVISSAGVKPARGHAQIDAFFSNLFKVLPPSARHRLQVKNVRQLDQWCAVDTGASIDYLAADGSVKASQKFTAFWLLQQNEKGWQIHVARAVEQAS